MALTTPNLSLRIWDHLSDPYDHDQLADNWSKVDYHDHTPERGVQIPTEGLADDAVTAPKIAPGAITGLGISDGSITTPKYANASVTLAKLADPTTGKVVGSAAGSAAAVYPPGYEIGYDQITANVSVTSNAEPGTQIIACAAHTFDGAPVLLEFWCAGYTVQASDFNFLQLYEGGTELGRIAEMQGAAGAIPSVQPLDVRYRFTPTAGSHIYTIYGTRTTNPGTVIAGTGAGGNAVLPAFARFTKV